MPKPPERKPTTSKGSSPSKGKGGGHDPLTQYMEEISRIKILTREEEINLAKAIKAGDPKAIQEMVRRNLKYVVTVANKYRGLGISLQDLIEEGNIGLIQAAKRFDVSRNVKFITYAVWWIKQAIMHSLAEQSGTVKLPVKQAGKVNKINKRSQQMTQDLEREPTQSEIAKSLGFGDEEINSIMRAYRTHLSLDSPLKDDENTPYLDLLENQDFIPYDDQLMQELLNNKVDQLLEDLSEREAKILKMRFGFFGEVKTLEEIGKEIGLSRERVRQIEKRAKLKLKTKLQNESWVDETE
ncbi:MAG: RNA polymerase sigma factor RpoD/SigA [Nitrospina sp.]|jgi:RNA polymerase primary sigma factor|nr:RNA polymerase sigma factor RpoD/SigA [Nitrospina sp.]MBT3511303.1 RNA polymerase sigma factor RpoD/SigA [Nitrospina sp.]MBT3875094.1 RNA polymerase sigma factor RpoD/SigA [Nitrospina sp.]MBT4047473.1 RNA polymerase sigma factor RpoD/SigA [Nitrospina sp.]MBT4558170.1 RNA polymerase sigma factor RpoD/SigA [Nitrospina sp.]